MPNPNPYKLPYAFILPSSAHSLLSLIESHKIRDMEDQKSHVEEGRKVCDICGKVLGQDDHCQTPNCPNNPDTTVGSNH
jgi:hypothetical protein